ncbi:MAG: hypothetical protein M1826_001452 [Phylliscum demangeonii]|nr:MAG: hypothetical protein M1826_001452 [Phylliscum demangeonii]
MDPDRTARNGTFVASRPHPTTYSSAQEGSKWKGRLADWAGWPTGPAGRLGRLADWAAGRLGRLADWADWSTGRLQKEIGRSRPR